VGCGDDDSEGGGCKGSKRGGGNKVETRDSRCINRGNRMVDGIEGRPGGEGRGEGSDGRLATGGGRTELRRLGTEAVDVICVAAGMHQGPLGRLEVGSEGDAVEGAWSMKSEAGDSTGEGLTGATSALAMGFPGNASVSGAGGKGVQVGDEGADGARWLRDVLCIGASCAGSDSG